MATFTQLNNAAEKAHQHALKLIYRHTHRDYKSSRNGVKSILTTRGLVDLDELSETEVAERLPTALKMEAARKEAVSSRASE
ncbi:hypothetical protein P2W50_31110 [Pseudomonas protegens]|uniref:hypothetical protein n=1 Tax=Pseudomonas protegens TaxID=380021 RepID=UPI0023ED5108|nr:hypothetical protein [Pseudomonas protegens]MDF4211102.1 hypothetical protein [Pseudomonas protegens]